MFLFSIRYLSYLNGDQDQFSKKVIQLKKQNKTDEYTTLVATEDRKIMENFDKKIEELTDYQQNLLDRENNEATVEV